MLRKFVTIAALSLTAGCSDLGLGLGETTCLTPEGHETVFSIFNEQVERSIANDLTGDFQIDKGKIRGAIQQVKFEIADVRTSKEDPNSTKKFCTGNLRVAFPATVLKEADEALAANDSGTVSQYANQLDYQRNANAFTIPVDFTVQPTDDGEAIYAEIEDGQSAFEFIGAILAAQLLRPKIVNAQIELERQEAEQAKAERDAEEAATLAELEEAKANAKLADQAINATWSALSQETRNQLLAVQRAWIKKKDTSCRLEAAQSSTEEKQREIAKLNCHARMNYSRNGELENYLDYYYD